MGNFNAFALSFICKLFVYDLFVHNFAVLILPFSEEGVSELDTSWNVPSFAVYIRSATFFDISCQYLELPKVH